MAKFPVPLEEFALGIREILVGLGRDGHEIHDGVAVSQHKCVVSGQPDKRTVIIG
jgi:hypothetical protein